MALNRWIGSISTDWSTAGNWLLGAIPTTAGSDTVWIDSAAQRDLLVNVDRTGDAGNGLHLALLHLHSTCNVKVGSASSPLKLTATKVVNDSPNEFHLTSQTGAAGAGVTGRVVQRGQGIFTYNAVGVIVGTITRLEVLGGRGTFNPTNTGGGVTTSLFVLQRFPEAELTLTGSATITRVNQAAGRVICNRDVGSSIPDYIFDAGEFDFQAGSIATCDQSGGSLIYTSLSASSVIGALNGLKGSIDFTRTLGHKTIGLVRTDPQRHAMLYDESMVTFSSPTVILGEMN